MKRVLVVDDDIDILEALGAILEVRYKVVLARNGDIALKHVLEAPFDAVLLDLMMPVLDGTAFMQELQARHIEVPVIIASAGTNLQAKVRELGAYDCVPKPFDITALEAKLAQAIAAHQRPDDNTVDKV